MNDFEKQVLARLDKIELECKHIKLKHEGVRELVIELRDKLEKDIVTDLLYTKSDIRKIIRLLDKIG